MKKAKQKRHVKDDEQGGRQSNDQVSVAKNATKCVVKEEITTEVSTAAVKSRNREQKRSAMKRKRSSSADVPELVQSQVDSEVMTETRPSRRRKTVITSVQNDNSLQQDKNTGQAVNKRQPSVKQRQSTWMRKSTSAAQQKKASKELLQKVSVADRKKSTKVKHDSPVKAVDKASVKTEKPDIAFTSPSQHSGKKFIGAHVSISGMCVPVSAMKFYLLYILVLVLNFLFFSCH